MQAWLDFHVEREHGQCAERGLFMEQRQTRRDLACLLLADVSMSTDAHLNDEHRVIDVIRDSLLLFGETLSVLGDDFALYGFSSLRRHQVRMQELKSFTQRYDDNTRGRIQGLKPGYYTRMGAAIRQATQLLGKSKRRSKLLLLLTDGKPNDLDLYEGRYGVEDTREAVLEARRQGLTPFCITIDREAGDYLPYMFGANGYTLIRQPEQLPLRLPQLYRQLTQPLSPRLEQRSIRCWMLRGSQKNIVTQKIVRPMQNHMNRRSRRSPACAANAGRGMPHWRHSVSCEGLACWQYKQTGMALTRTVPGADDREWRSGGRPG